MKITYYGHSCFRIETMGKHLLFDPFIRPNALAKDINIDAIPVDYVLISHGHEDHIADALSILERTGATLIANYEIVSWYKKQGITNSHSMNLGGSWNFDFGKVKFVQAVHSSSFSDGSYAGSAGGFLIETSEGNFYYSGDTALTCDMKLIGDYKKIDFAFLCIGNNYTMSLDNAIIASDYIRCDRIIGMHYDTFEPIRIDHQEAKDKFKRAGKELTLMPIGSTTTR